MSLTGPTDICGDCGHGGLTGGVPPATCPTCGGIYGHANTGGKRCRQCNRNVIGVGYEAEAWLSLQVEEETTVTVTPGTRNDPPK